MINAAYWGPPGESPWEFFWVIWHIDHKYCWFAYHLSCLGKKEGWSAGSASWETPVEVDPSIFWMIWQNVSTSYESNEMIGGGIWWVEECWRWLVVGGLPWRELSLSWWNEGFERGTMDEQGLFILGGNTYIPWLEKGEGPTKER